MLGFDALGRLALGQVTSGIITAAVAAAAGVGAASAVGTGIKVTTTVTAAGVGAASAVGTGIKTATTVTAAGVGGANGAGARVFGRDGVAAGAGAAAATGTGINYRDVAAAGIGSANAVGSRVNGAVGSASGLGAASAISFYFTSTASVLKPDGDVSDGGWTNELGGTLLNPSIDETTPLDDDYIVSSPNPVNDVCEINLSNPSGGVIAPLAVMYRYKKVGAGVINLHVRLMEGATEIASWDHANVDDDFVIANQVLNQTQVDLITNAANLTVEFEASV